MTGMGHIIRKGFLEVDWLNGPFLGGGSDDGGGGVLLKVTEIVSPWFILKAIRGFNLFLWTHF